LVASYDLRPGNGAGPIFWKIRDRRRIRREGKTHKKGRRKNTNRKGKQKQKYKLEYGQMPNLMVALPNTGGALCSTPQSLADAHYWSAVH